MGHGRGVVALALAGALGAGLLVVAPLASPATAAAGPPVTFALAAYGTGGYPYELAVGDVDEDSELDAVVVKESEGSLALLLGDGASGFGAPSELASGGTNPSDVALGDVDGDAHLDVVTTNSGTNSVAVRQGDGTGAFGPATTYAAGASQYALALHDVNDDDRVDLVTTGSGSVNVLLGQAGGTFAPGASYPSITSSYSVAVGDLDGDDIPDLAVGGYGGSTGRVVVLVGHGDGTFAPASTVVTGLGSVESIAIGDLNGDASPDLALGAGRLEILLGNGDATFLRGASQNVGSCSCRVALADLNGDTFTDAALSTELGVVVAHGNGDGTFAPHTDFPGSGQARDLVVVDLDGDGLLDVVAPTLSRTVEVLLNTPGLPLAPTIGTAVSGAGSATVSWTAPAVEGASPVTGYVVYPYINSVQQPPHTFDSTATTQTLTGLTDGSSFTFRVAAVNAVGVGQASASTTYRVVIGLVPDAPTMKKALPGNGSASLSWTTPDASPPVGGYVISVYQDATRIRRVFVIGRFNSQRVTGLANGTEYRFTVAANNAVGLGPESLPSNVVVPRPDPPGAPGWISVRAGNAKVRLEWVAPASNGGSPITGYIVTPYRNGVVQEPVAFSTPSTVQALTGLTNGVSYRFTVSAVNAFGIGPPSTQSSSVTPVAPATVPGAPDWVSVRAGNAKVRLEWVAPASNGGATITGYIVTPYKDGVAQTPVTFLSRSTVQALTGLTNGASYTFRVRAFNSVGTGASSPLSPAVRPNP